jgi:hypothetical protein
MYGEIHGKQMSVMCTKLMKGKSITEEARFILRMQSVCYMRAGACGTYSLTREHDLHDKSMLGGWTKLTTART